MSLPTSLRGLSEVKGALTADPSGRLLEADPDVAGQNEAAAAMAVGANGFSVAGDAAKLGSLATILVKGAASSTVTAIRPGGLLLVTVDPATTTTQVERALKDWAPQAIGSKPAAAPIPAGAPRPAAPRRPTPPPSKPVTSPKLSAVRPSLPPSAPRAAPAKPVADPWGALRRTLGRGQLNEAVTYQSQLAASHDPDRPGSEQVDPEESDRAVRALLEASAA